MNVLATAAVALRLLNPHDVAIDATLHCGGELRSVRLDAYELRDVEGCQSGDALVPVGVLQTFVDDDDREWQRGVAADACGDVPPAMAAPLFACRNGVAAAYVAPVEGATYAWSANGALITAGATTNRVSVQLGDAPTATLTCVISLPECSQTATGIIAVREPIVVKSLTVPGVADANRPLSISWSYEPGHEPATQVLAGDLFPEPVTLAADARSYTLTPDSAGSRTVELRASYGRATTVATAKKRRRAVGGGATATECPSAIATAGIEVRGCATRKPSVDAPENVPAGETFEAKIADLLDGEEVVWTVQNGTIASLHGKRVLIVAGASGRTEVHARVERTPGCFTAGSASVAIIQPLGSCSVPPSAALSIVVENCDRAIVRATFTGKPPFEGRWSDGKTFRSTAMSLDHEFRNPGTYGVKEFHDSSCFGVVSGSPTATMRGPSVQLQGVEGCAGGEVTATFTGTPPFAGTWSDGLAFTTASSSITRAVPSGTWSVKTLTDATCPTSKTSSNSVTFAAQPRASVAPEDVCYIPADSYFFDSAFTLETKGGKPPYVYEFIDGHIVTTSLPRIHYQVPTTVDHRKWELKRVTANGCEAALDNRVTTIHRRIPVQLSGGPINACTLTDITIAPASPPSPDAQIMWGLFTEPWSDVDPVIVSGGNSPQVTIRAKRAGQVKVRVRSDWEGFCYYDSSITVNFTVCHD